jgi:hypothetical protein
MTVEDHAPDSSTAARHRLLGYAWLAVSFALAIHVIDEADHDFLAVYQPAATGLHRWITFLPMPIVSFGGWLAGLAVVVLALLVLSPLAFRGGRWIRGASYGLAALMAANALTHCLGTLHFNRLLPGTWSAMLLLLAAAWLLVAARRTTPGHHFPLGP